MADRDKTQRQSISETRRKMQILHAALRCGAKKGLAGMTMDDVSQAARLSKGLPFYYFKSKQKLYLAMIDLFTRDVGEQAFEILRSEVAEETILSKLARAFVGSLTVNCKHPTMLIEFWTLGLRDREIAARLCQVRELMQARIAEILERGMASGTFHCSDANQAAHSLYCSLMGICSQWVIGNRAFDPMLTVDTITNAFLTNLESSDAASGNNA
jgi:TetR/AcrR family transcriptional regulator, fatty acid metabolism regulator protein